MFHGSLVALVTPMQANGEVDFSALKKLIDWHLENGTNAIVVTGTTGEAPTLEHEEQLAIIRSAVEQVAQRIPVIAGTGTNCTRKTIALTKEAMELGVDACLLVTPYYNKPTQEGLYRHYLTIAEAVPIPQILYNVPGRTGCEILPATVERLLGVPNIIGIKEGRVEQAKEFISRCPGLDVFSGDDISALDIILLGGKGVISVTANVAPKTMAELCRAALEGQRDLAMKLNQQLLHLHKDLFLETNPIPVKWAMQAMGLIQSGIRLPLTVLAEQYQPRIRTALEQAGISHQKGF